MNLSHLKYLFTWYYISYFKSINVSYFLQTIDPYKFYSVYITTWKVKRMILNLIVSCILKSCIWCQNWSSDSFSFCHLNYLSYISCKQINNSMNSQSLISIIFIAIFCRLTMQYMIMIFILFSNNLIMLMSHIRLYYNLSFFGCLFSGTCEYVTPHLRTRYNSHQSQLIKRKIPINTYVHTHRDIFEGNYSLQLIIWDSIWHDTRLLLCRIDAFKNK